MESLNDYIQAQREAGSVESAGSFTLAIEKARDKLGSYTLANEEDYILKLVQSAVSLQVETLNFQFTNSTVLVYFELGRKDTTLSVDNLTSALLTPLEEKNAARAYLAMALCSVAALEPVELMWGDWDGDDTALVFSLGHGRSELFQSVPFPRTEPLDSERRMHLLFFKKKRSQKLPLSQTTAEQEVLRSRCCFAPVQIEISGVPIGPQVPHFLSPSDPVHQLSDLYLGSLSLETSANGPICWRRGMDSKKSYAASFQVELPETLKKISPQVPPVFHFDKPVEWDAEDWSSLLLSRVLGFPCYLYGPSFIHFIKDGVLLDPVRVHDAGGGAFAIVDGREFKTDVTGLNIVRDETVAAIIEETVTSWKQLVDRYISEDPPLFRSTVISSSDEAFWFVFGCCLVGPLAGILKPFLEHFIQSERKRAILLKRYHRQLKTRRGYLAYFREQNA